MTLINAAPDLSFVFLRHGGYLVRNKKASCMKKNLLLFLFIPVLFSCNKQTSPKETSQAFITALASADFTTASSLTSTDTKAVLDKARKDVKSTASPEESFQLSSLAESVKENTAEVRNDIIALPLVKEDKGWKVVLSDELLQEIQGREEMQTVVKAKWDALQKEYEARLQVLKDYIGYKKGMGALTPKVTLLNEAVSKFTPQQQWTRENVLAYAQKQQQLNNIIDAGLEPAMAANTDLSLRYFLQISNAGDRIKAAEREYQAIAEKAHSPIYAPLPVKAPSTLTVNAN